jgi:ribosome-associated translation inhibitor RaiA
MEVPLQITLRDMKRSEALSRRIRSDADRLERQHPEIMRCRVVVEEANRHSQHGRAFAVHVELKVPGRDSLVSTLQRNDDVYVAVRDAFDSVRRQFG